ncbi:hypothetical protein J3A83DRAFT_4356717 [Scleroderma citrinum]
MVGDIPPAHLKVPKVHTSRVQFCDVMYCNCQGSEDSHIQLMMAGLFPVTTKEPRTVFTFQVLNDFIRDNVECGTLAMNYYSKLHQITSNAFPHLVPDRYRELLRVSWMWQLFKLMKWNGVDNQAANPSSGDLVLFFPACPQPGVNILETKANLSQIVCDCFSWKFSRSIVMDGNFKAEHMRPRNPAEEVWLMDGRGFMVGSRKYKEYLVGTQSECSNHQAVNQANATRKQLASTGIGGCACARHGCFIPYAMVDFQKGEQ